MASDAGCVTSVLGRDVRHVFEGLGSMVRVGSGTGAMAKGFAGAFPGLKCVVLDLPRVVEGLEGSENLRFVGGDMFESIPHADAVFLKWVLHDWSDEDCVKILKNCKEAVSFKGGKVILVEVVVEDRGEDDQATQTQLFFDMKMMVEINGRERSEKEWAKFVHLCFVIYRADF
ncbi:Xanthohumol 4-O-methyltransferase, variant 2 [Salvia divinorum]